MSILDAFGLDSGYYKWIWYFAWSLMNKNFSFDINTNSYHPSTSLSRSLGRLWLRLQVDLVWVLNLPSFVKSVEVIHAFSFPCTFSLIIRFIFTPFFQNLEHFLINSFICKFIYLYCLSIAFPCVLQLARLMVCKLSNSSS